MRRLERNVKLAGFQYSEDGSDRCGALIEKDGYRLSVDS
jgi:hypothetical protein